MEREDFDIVIKVSKKGRERTRIIDREGVLSNVYYSIKKALENGIGNEFETETLPNSYIGLATADWCQVVSQIVENKNGYALRVVVMKWRSGAAKRPHSAGVTERSFSKPAEIIKKYWGQK